MAVSRPRLAALIVLSSLLAGVGLAGAWAAKSADRSDPVAAYGALSRAASAGDPRAQELLSAVDRYASERGLSIEDLGLAVPTVDGETVGIQQFRLEGTPPWELRVLNDTEIRDPGSFAAYLALREATLLVLASADPARQVEVVASPDAVVSLPEFAKALQCDCGVGAVTVDVFAGEQWVMSAGGDFGGATFSTSSDSIADRLLSSIEGSLDLYDGLSASDLTLSVRSVHLVLAAGDAAEAATRPGVLLLDPLTDVHDRYAERAAIVRVVNTPDVFRWHAEQVLGLSLLPDAISPDGPEGEGR